MGRTPRRGASVNLISRRRLAILAVVALAGAITGASFGGPSPAGAQQIECTPWGPPTQKSAAVGETVTYTVGSTNSAQGAVAGTYSVDWGDGEFESGSFGRESLVLEHQYEDPGRYEIIGMIDDGGCHWGPGVAIIVEVTPSAASCFGLPFSCDRLSLALPLLAFLGGLGVLGAIGWKARSRYPTTHGVPRTSGFEPVAGVGLHDDPTRVGDPYSSFIDPKTGEMIPLETHAHPGVYGVVDESDVGDPSSSVSDVPSDDHGAAPDPNDVVANPQTTARDSDQPGGNPSP